MPNLKKATRLYNNLLKYELTEIELGTENEFIIAISNIKSAEKIYDSLIDIGFNKYEIGSKIKFLNTFVHKSFWEKVSDFINEIIKRFKIKKLY
jgi:hypothetical protein